MNILIKQATILSSQSKHHLKQRDILIKNGIIEKIAKDIRSNVKIYNAKDLFVSVGWLDLFADYCDPGKEYKENIESGLSQAEAGGFTDVCLVPDSAAFVSTKSGIEYIKNKAQNSLVQLHPIGSISSEGKEEKLSEMYDMRSSGALFFSDGRKSVQNAGLLLKALQYIKAIDATIIQLPDTKSISAHGLMHEGKISTSFGMPGIPEIAETLQVQRDISLCDYAESKIHFTGVSTKNAVELIYSAKQKGVQCSCSVSPYHLIFNDEALETYDANYKLNPPLRSEKTRQYLIKAIKDGKIEAVASHHFPQDIDAKNVEFEYAQAGMISQQFILSLLIKAGLEAADIAKMLAEGPRSIAQLEKNIAENEEACLTIFSMTENWELNKQTNLSKSTNSPFMETKMIGKVKGIVNGNKSNL